MSSLSQDLQILFHWLLTFTADILVVYALWFFFFFFPSHCVISEKVVLHNSKFCGKLEERKMRRTGLSLLRYLLWLGTMFCFVLFPNYASVPSTVQDLAALKESTISRVCLLLLLHLFTFSPQTLKISFAFLPVKHSFWR